MSKQKAYTLEARLGAKRVKRQYHTKEEAENNMRALVAQYPIWTEKDFATVTQNN